MRFTSLQPRGVSSRIAARARQSFLIRIAVIALSAGLGLGPAGQAAANGAPPTFIAQKHSAPPPTGAATLCRDLAWSCKSSGHNNAPSPAQIKLAQRVNSRINQTIPQVDDIRQYRTEEYWALPSAQGGDCEDLALLKKRELIAAGIAPERLLMATVLDRQIGSHAVLVLRTDTGDLILDNLTDRVLPWQHTGYSFLRMQDPDNKRAWVAVLAGGIFDKHPNAATGATQRGRK